MHNPIRTTLTTITLSLLSIACAPQNVKNDETGSSSYGSAGSGDEIAEVEKAGSPEPTPKQVPETREPVAKPQQGAKTPADQQFSMTSEDIAEPVEASIKPTTASSTAETDTPEPAEDQAGIPEQPELDLSTTQETTEGVPEPLADPEAVGEYQEPAVLTGEAVLPEDAPAESPEVETKALDIADLPLTFGDRWSLDRRPGPIDRKAGCLLSSRSVNIPDGYERTDVQLLLTADILYVKTDSNIDLSYQETGIRFDDGTLLPFDNLATETTARIDKDISTLYERMTSSRTILVRLGFWPSWPVTKTQEAGFSMDGFDEALRALRLCEKM